MKKILLVLIIVCMMSALAGCSITPPYPTEGIWYNDELKLVLDFDRKKPGISYDEKLSGLELEVRFHRDRYVDIVYYDESSYDVIDIYSGWRKYKDDKLVITLYSKANPEDNFKTQIELDNEEYVFVRVESYEEISELVSN